MEKKVAAAVAANSMAEMTVAVVAAANKESKPRSAGFLFVFLTHAI